MTSEITADLVELMPEIWLTGTIIATLIVDLVFGHRYKQIVGYVALVGTLGAVNALYGTSGQPERVFGVITADGFSLFFRMVILSGTALIVLFASVFRDLASETRNEFYPMVLGAALGGCFLVSTDHLLMLVLGMELLSLCSYILAGWQKTERRSSEAALKYLVYGAMSSGLMLFGFSLLYGISGSLWMPEVALAVTEQWDLGGDGGRAVVVAASVLTFVGLGFKIAAFPFHFWAPDVYEGSPMPVTTMLAVVSKAAGIGVFVRFVDGVFLDQVVSVDWVSRLGGVVAMLAAVTMTYGNVTAVKQTNVKRLLAYSSIAHAGFLVMGIAVMLCGDGRAYAGAGMATTLFYLGTYYFGTLGAFGCAMAIANRFGAEELDDYVGLGWSTPWIGGAFVLFLASLTGLPPTVGFAGKLVVFRAALDSGLGWLALVGALNALVSLFYYFKIARALFLRGGTEVVPGIASRGALATLAHAAVFLLAAGTLWCGVGPGLDALMTWVGRSLL